MLIRSTAVGQDQDRGQILGTAFPGRFGTQDAPRYGAPSDAAPIFAYVRPRVTRSRNAASSTGPTWLW